MLTQIKLEAKVISLQALSLIAGRADTALLAQVGGGVPCQPLKSRTSESRANRRSPGHPSGEWRLYWLSGQVLCRSSIGAALRGSP
jgi:hypothetical protein